MSVQASVVLATARTLLNDDAATMWTDPVLIPKLQQAHRELSVKLRRAAAELMKAEYIETITAGGTTFTSQPADLVNPITLWEKLAADPVSSYVLMTEASPLPNVVAAATMIYWQFKAENVKFIGSSANRQIKMLYWRSLPEPTVNTDTIGFIGGELYLAPRVAALATGATGQGEEFATLTGMADASLQEIIVFNRGRAPQIQNPVVKP